MQEKEMKQFKRREIKKSEEIYVKNSKNMKIVLNILDNFIAGQRFGEMDSGKQMYLLHCQSKIAEMQDGYYTEDCYDFLYNTIDSLMVILTAAGIELDKIFGKENKDAQKTNNN